MAKFTPPAEGLTKKLTVNVPISHKCKNTARFERFC